MLLREDDLKSDIFHRNQLLQVTSIYDLHFRKKRELNLWGHFSLCLEILACNVCLWLWPWLSFLIAFQFHNLILDDYSSVELVKRMYIFSFQYLKTSLIIHWRRSILQFCSIRKWALRYVVREMKYIRTWRQV